MKNLLYLLCLFSVQFAFAQSELPENGFPIKKLENTDSANKADFCGFHRLILMKNVKKSAFICKICQICVPQNVFSFYRKAVITRRFWGLSDD
jgi:copper oxidase (laccase) domain-containing protein